MAGSRRPRCATRPEIYSRSSKADPIETFDLDEVLRALSHPDRRAFVAACRDGPHAAGELAELSALSLATVSEHLKVLRKSGLLMLDKRGRFWMYRTDAAVVERTAREVAAIIAPGK